MLLNRPVVIEPMSRLFSGAGGPVPLAGPDLHDREHGERAYATLAQWMRGVREGETLLLDFDGIRMTDASFADASVVELHVRGLNGEFGDRFLALRGLSRNAAFNIELALDRRRTRSALIAQTADAWQLIGHIEPNLRETLALVMERGSCTARHLADLLTLEINTASMRLKKLYEARLTRRHEEVSAAGRQHVYEPLI